MTHRRKTLLRAIAPVAALTLALTACGSDDGDDSGDKKNDKSSSESSDTSGSDDGDDATDEPTEEAPANTGDLPLGQAASEEKEIKRGDGTLKAKITADKVDTGENADLTAAGFSADKVKGKYPVYAYFTYEITEQTGEISPGTDLNSTTAVLDAEGKPGSRFIAIGGQPLKGGCPEKDRELEWKKGTKATLCTTFLMDEGKEPTKLAYGMVNPLLWAVK
ncbi:hypothetical protein JGS22_014865 [Streptomyces sp. P38-E01]|uniref:Lipoprotein n=1 Tax=Streptomyces tardus TaxID=2780544 RepID=A0A949JHS1_9ACTN|nr:hypothetical protein [Streptomyces tardus]MBU7598860.1 hypothetical protein [Streptomyces tardus]